MAVIHNVPLNDAQEATLNRMTQELNRPSPPNPGGTLTPEQVTRRLVWRDIERAAQRHADIDRTAQSPLRDRMSEDDRAAFDALLVKYANE